MGPRDTIYTVAAVNNTQERKLLSKQTLSLLRSSTNKNKKNATRRAPLLKRAFMSIQPEQVDRDGRRFVF